MENMNYEGMWDYDGAYDPNKPHAFHSETFSVGVFQWVKRASGKGLKRTAVVKRIRGSVSNPEEVYSEAQKCCDQLNHKAHP